jgi:WD40 repeat protein
VRILRGHRGPLRAVAYAPDGSFLATAGDDGLVRLWDPVVGRDPSSLLPHGRPLRGVSRNLAFSPDGKSLAVGANGISVWDLATRTEILNEQSGFGHSVAFTPDGRWLVSCAWFAGPMESTVACYDIATGQRRTPFGNHPSSGEGVTCSARANLLALAFCEYAFGRHRNFVCLWNFANMQEQPQLDNGRGAANRIQSLAFSPGGRLLAVAAGPDVVIWDVTNHSQHGRLGGHVKQVNSVCFSPDGNQLLTGSNDGTVRLWDAATFRQRTVFDWETGRVRCVAFAPDGMTAVVVGERRKVVIWDVDG